MAGSFMSGLIGGFMSTGGGSAVAGGAGKGDMTSQLNAGAKPSQTPNATPGGADGPTGKTSQAMSTDSASGGIVRENPYGEGATSTPEVTKTPSAEQVSAGKALKGFGDSMSKSSARESAGFGGGSTYGALFGTGGSAFQSSAVPGMSGGGGAAMAPVATPQMPMAAPMLPTPMQLPTAPQAPMVAPVQLAVSDVRAKTNINLANGEMDRFLNTVYKNVVSKRNK